MPLIVRTASTLTQFLIEQRRRHPEASGDFNVTADNGNDTTHFINFGIKGCCYIMTNQFKIRI